MANISPALFPDRREWLNLALPVVLLLAVALTHGLGAASPLDQDGYLLLNALFFSDTHVFITLFMLARLPEFRAVTRREGRPLWHWSRLAVALVVVLLLYKLSLINEWPLPPHLIRGFKLFLLLLWTQHSSKQSFGLSLLYNRRWAETAPPPPVSPSPASLPPVSRPSHVSYVSYVEKFERRLFQIFFAVLVTQMVGAQFSQALGGDVQPWLYGSVLPLLSIGIFYPRGLRLKKLLFNARFALLVLGAESPLAYVGYSAVHGWEYLLISMQITENSSLANGAKRKWLLPLGCLLITLPYLLFSARDEFGLLYPSWPAWGGKARQGLGLALFVCTYLHYYLDRYLFRFKDTAVREHIGPLLSSTPVAPTCLPAPYEDHRASAWPKPFSHPHRTPDPLS